MNKDENNGIKEGNGMEGKGKENIAGIIEKRAKEYQKAQLDLLKELVSYDTGSGNKEGNDKVVGILTKELEALGASVKLVKGEYGSNIVAKINENSPKGKILLSAHLDTVFKPGEAAKHPFKIEGEYAYGLGISDDKAGAVVAYYALKIMNELNKLPAKEIVVIFNCDEEIGSPTSKDIFKEEAKNAEYAFVFEPARENNGIITQRGGIGYYTMEVWGNEVHAGMRFQEGRNAVVELADKALKLHNMTKLEDKLFVNVSSIDGGNDFSVPVMLPGYAKMKFSVRLKDPDIMEQVMKEVKALENQIIIDGCKVKIQGEFVYVPMKRENNLGLYEIAKKAGKNMGIELDEIYTASGSDANHIASHGVPTIDALGAYYYGIHTKEEHILIASLTERTQLFANILGLL